MPVKPKDIATFLLGAAAGAAVLKYTSMSDEEKEELINSIKNKANDFKNQAEVSVDKAKDYFTELKSKSSDFLKDNWSEAENYLQELFKGKTEDIEEFADNAAEDVKDTANKVGNKVENAFDNVSDKIDNVSDGDKNEGNIIPA